MAILKAPKHGGRETFAAIADQAFLGFQQRHVRPPANEAEQIVAMGLDTTGTTISPVAAGEISPLVLKRATQRTALAMLTPKRLAAALCDMPLPPPPHNAFAKILGKRHPRRPLRAATIFKQIKADSGIPHNSIEVDEIFIGGPRPGKRGRGGISAGRDCSTTGGQRDRPHPADAGG